jgi:hypothetical protein
MMGEALSLYRMLAHLGHTELDTAAVLKLYERQLPSELGRQPSAIGHEGSPGNVAGLVRGKP